MVNATTSSAPQKAQASIAAAKAKAALKALKQESHEDAAKYFFTGILGIIAVFTLLHWSRIIYKRYAAGSAALKFPVSVTRVFRKIFTRKVPGFVSGGHTLVYLAYIAVCLSILFTNLVEFTDTHEFAKRLGWLTASNICLVVFLSLKNTPLGFLTAYSHERLNPLHQLAGYTTIACMLAHAIVYIHYWSITNNEYQLKYLVQRMGYVSAFSMLILLATTFLLRKKQYELFHILHILLAVMIITTAALHRPDIATHSCLILITAGSIWGLDRVLRFSKFSFAAIGNTATVTPLPHSGTRIVLKKKLPFAIPGNHCYLWIPGVRSTESHPFTIISTNPVEMVVSAHDGFTQDLHDYATKNPGKTLMASVDGPYGTVPNFTSFTKILFIAGGSGASFTFGVAVDLVRKLGEPSGTTIEFIWVMKDQEQLAWFSTHLKELASSPLVTLKIHSTSPPSTPISQLELKTSANSVLTSDSDLDIEKAGSVTSVWPMASLTLQHGRPSVTTCIKQAVETASKSDRIAVAACGPESMMLETRKMVAECIKVEGPAIELHSEHFGS